MKLHSIHSIPPSYADEAVFKYSARKSLLFVLSCAGVAAACFWLAELGGYQEHGWHLTPFVLRWIGSVMGAVALIGQWYFRKALRASNWLVKTRTNSLLIKYRSYLNDHFLEDDAVVVEIPWCEIQWIRKTKETRSSPSLDCEGGNTISFHTFLDLKLNPAQSEELKRALLVEQNRQAPLSEKAQLCRELFQARKRGVSSAEILQWKQEINSDRLKNQPRQPGGIHHHHPVRMIEPSILRVEWNAIHPRIAKVLDLLSRWVPLEPPLKLKPSDRQRVKGQDLDDQILDLAQRGEVLAAVRLVRGKYGMALSESRQFVDDLLSS